MGWRDYFFTIFAWGWIGKNRFKFFWSNFYDKLYSSRAWDDLQKKSLHVAGYGGWRWRSLWWPCLPARIFPQLLQRQSLSRRNYGHSVFREFWRVPWSCKAHKKQDQVGWLRQYYCKPAKTTPAQNSYSHDLHPQIPALQATEKETTARKSWEPTVRVAWPQKHHQAPSNKSDTRQGPTLQAKSTAHQT